MKKQCISFLFVSALLLIFFSFSCTGISGYDIESNKDKVCESNKLKIVAVIPARYESSRFPGKPLSDICGKPMIWWVYNQAKKVPELNEVYVATDDKRIENVCKQYNINVIMTSKDCKTGTDRVAEVSEKINADLYVNIQGDEPLIEPETILKAIEPFYSDKKLQVSNLMTKIIDPVDVINNTIPKVITNKDGVGIYLTRTTAPYPKGSLNFSYYKQVCVYVFTPEALKFFHNSERGKIEKVEDIEILRFIENGYKVQYVEVDSSSVAVDTQKDLNRVRTLIKEKLKKEDKNNIKILDCTLRDGGYVNDWNFGKENIEGIIN